MRSRQALSALACLLAGAATAAGDASVKRTGETLRVQASAAPLADVLSAFARETGARVSYEGEPPDVRVTLDFEATSPAEAVMRMVEGLGVRYLIGIDDARVMKVFVVSGTADARAPGATPIALDEATPRASARPIFSTDPVDDDYHEVARPRAPEQRSPPPQVDHEPPPRPLVAPPSAADPAGALPSRPNGGRHRPAGTITGGGAADN